MTFIEHYTKKIQQLINHLPNSDIRFLTFVEGKKKFKPKLNTIAKIWIDEDVHPSPLYIVPGVRSENFFYVHRESQIKYNVYLNDLDQVIGYDPLQSIQEVMETLKGGNVRANWGNHITIGVNEMDDMIMFCNHITEYKWNNKLTLDDRRSITCNVPLMNVLNETSVCFTWGVPDGTTMEKYKTIANDPDAFAIIQAVHRKILDTTIGGRKRNKKENIMKGGNLMYSENGFTEEFVSFILETKVNPVTETKSGLCEVILIDDNDSKYMMMRYNEDVGDGMDEWIIHSNAFAMDKEFVKDAYAIYQIPLEERTVEQMQTYERFITTGLVPVGQLIAAY